MTKDDAKGLSASERRAAKERAAEVREQSGKPTTKKAARELQQVLDTIAAMPEPDRAVAGRLHEVITAAAPELAPRLWYSQPAYALDGKVLCFVRSGEKDEVRYTTLGFNDIAQLDDGTCWPTSFAVTEVTAAVATTVTQLIEKATASST